MPPKGNKQWVKPGLMATMSAYERQKMNRVNLLNQKKDALGLKHLSTSLMSSVQPNCTNKNGKRIRDNEGDDDYRPSDGDDDSDGDSSDSLVHESREMPLRRQLTFSSGTAAPHAEANSTPAVVGTQRTEAEISPTEVETISSSVASNSRRGQTRGIHAQQLVEKMGKLPVPIPVQFRAPVGSYANKFASAIGIQVRQHLPDVTVRRWSDVSAASSAPIVHRLEIVYGRSR